MILSISAQSGEPLQNQIFRQIKAYILSGVLASDFILPSIRALAREQKVSVITVQRAYENLEREGLIYSAPAKGFFVANLKEEVKFELSKNSAIDKIRPIIKSAKNEGMSKSSLCAIIIDEINQIYS